MNNDSDSLSELATLLQQRLAIVGTLATSLESARPALLRHDAEAIARGAAHQAELCRQWNRLEGQLRAEAARRLKIAGASDGAGSVERVRSAKLEEEWQTLRQRLAYITRVHWSLLRHMQRSLGILQRVVDSCAATYAPAAGAAGSRLSVRAGE